MFFLVSFHLLDLRFVVERASAQTTRDPWLKPQWLWADRKIGTQKITHVGRLGPGTPIPGRNRDVPDFNRHATVDGGLVLQTAEEFAGREIRKRAALGDFFIVNRELVAGDGGQLRFDLLLERAVTPDTLQAVLQSLMAVNLTAPLAAASGESALLDSQPVVAAVYETESLKTCTGFHDDTARNDCMIAASGSVLVASDAPNVVLIDVDRELAPASPSLAKCTAPFSAELRLAAESINGADLLVWHLLPAGVFPMQRDVAIRFGWNAAFGLCWLVGQVHELTAFKTRLEEYDAKQLYVRSGLVRSAIIERTRWFAKDTYGGWNAREVLKFAVHSLWVARNQADERVKEIMSFANNPRDVGGAAGPVINIAKLADNLTFNSSLNQLMEGATMTQNTTMIGNITGSIVNLNSTLTNVTQTIGALPKADASTKDELQKLVTDLFDLLGKVPDAKKDDAAALSQLTKELLDKANTDKPNKTLLTMAIEAVKSTAQTLKDVAPTVLPIVASIGGLVVKMFGF